MQFKQRHPVRHRPAPGGTRTPVDHAYWTDDEIAHVLNQFDQTDHFSCREQRDSKEQWQ
ncbi:hypothetical protein [Larsenimonas suaedae]|uniref:Uncharacterized protein n=1 Tax=Larsenimonas suaedae TaxID=1851019 RepID=A0ABU1H156_9GAMM|nr:hypothetical protein [Larsenimonas suaedae]MCM2973744.1 hypothetical protein [Larsenimonas suaedae]MDR5897268.1 hypothetical protein [Larsenimonas suaedae]